MTLKQRHNETDKCLKSAASGIINNNKLRDFSKEIAKKYGISGQTVINYVYGQGKDGYLKDSILSDLKKSRHETTSKIR